MQFAIKALGMFGSGLGGAELSKTYKVLQKNVRKVDVEHFMAQFLVLKFCTKITIPTWYLKIVPGLKEEELESKRNCNFFYSILLDFWIKFEIDVIY